VTGNGTPAATRTHSVAVEPSGICLDVSEGETIMGAAERSGYRWPTLCHGGGTCSICWVEVTAGDDHLSAMKDDERETLGLLSRRLRATRAVRLACQARVEGDVIVRKPGVRPKTPDD
jgi:ferredoxin, 2Fe-2S